MSNLDSTPEGTLLPQTIVHLTASMPYGAQAGRVSPSSSAALARIRTSWRAGKGAMLEPGAELCPLCHEPIPPVPSNT